MSYFQPPPETKFTFLSLGAGVQSSALALMAAKGEIGPMPDAAIFADTQAEPQNVYDWLDWLEEQLPFPVYRVSKGDLAKAVLTMRTTKDGRRFTKTDIPVFTLSADGKKGMVPQRACTADYKIQPIRKKVKELAGIKRGQTEITATQWIGISWDEMQRMKESRDKWCQHRWPLIEKRITRQQCKDWMKENGYPEPPRSSCVFCPYHDNKEWRRLKVDEPEAFEKALQFEKAQTDNFVSTPYLHRSCKPLGEVDFRSEEDKGQLDMFQHECEGMCGL